MSAEGITSVIRYQGNLAALAENIHHFNKKWWQHPDGSPKELDKGERFMLMVSELAEALEGDRKSLQDDKLPQYPMIVVELADCVIRVLDSFYVYWPEQFGNDPVEGRIYKEPKTVGARLLNITALLVHCASTTESDFVSLPACYAKSVIEECLAFGKDLGFDLWDIVYDKCVYNVDRADHKWENRLAGGKAY